MTQIITYGRIIDNDDKDLIGQFSNEDPIAVGLVVDTVYKRTQDWDYIEIAVYDNFVQCESLLEINKIV